MQCPSCGASLPEGEQSCLTCGRAFVSAPSPEREQSAPEQTTLPQPEVAPTLPVFAPPSPPSYGYPSQPLSGPPSQPYYGAPPSMPLLGAQPSTASGAARILLGGIPLWIGTVALLSVGAIVLVGLLLRLEWARIAVVAGIDAAIGAGLILVAAIVILLVRRAQWLTLGLSVLLILVLGLGSVAALTNQPTIHRLQGQNLENSKQWAAAITQDSRAGEAPPHAPDIARVRLEWGEEFLARGVYDFAVDQFHQALEDDTSSAMADRANQDLYKAFTAWLQAGAPDEASREISAFLEAYLSKPECDSTCQQATRPLVAQALYQYGDYRLKQNRSYFCSEVATDYKDLVSRYPGTSGAQKASAALAEPVTFTATLPDLHNPQGLHVWLSKKVAPETHDYITYFSQDYAANLDANGIATFKNVVPGVYNFSLLQRDGFHTYWRKTDPFNPYTETVPPICGGSDWFYFS
jgi:tetratricopeptide (TPR) repeat protein